MKETFELSGLGFKNKFGDSVLSFKLSSQIGPGYLLELYQKIQPYDGQQVTVTIEPIQSQINLETGEVI